jgi:hypothetical protein
MRAGFALAIYVPLPHPTPRRRQHPELSGLGYINFFWPLLGSTFAAVVLIMLRMRLFTALM